MKRLVITHNVIEGFHNYPEAPDFCDYLRSRHRHNFVVECHFEVSNNDREIEINQQQLEISAFFEEFGRPAEFGSMSCESIAESILERFENAVYCKVLEDNYGGAALSR